MAAADRYPVEVFWSDEDQGYIAIAPDLPGSSAFGETQKEAIGELQDAIDAWIQAATAAGNTVPAPSRPVEQRFNGKVLVRMPRELHARLSRRAKAQDVSLNQFVVYLLAMLDTPAEASPLFANVQWGGNRANNLVWLTYGSVGGAAWKGLYLNVSRVEHAQTNSPTMIKLTGALEALNG